MARVEEPRTLNIEGVPGQDYDSVRAVRAAFYAGEEFIVRDGHGEWSGQRVTRASLRAAGFIAAHVCFRGGRSTYRLETAALD